jgi:hypothetical protein
VTEETPGIPALPPESAPAEAAAAEPVVPQPPNVLGGNDRKYDFRFIAVYATLGAVLLAAMAGFIVIIVKPSPKPAAPWSAWQPTPGTVATMSTQIANHVSHSYHLNKSGTQLVAVVPSKPTVTSGTTNIAIKAIAIRKAANTNTGIEVLTGSDVTGSEMFTFCGLGAHCSIAGGTASRIRGRLVRREALEVALYTFKFVPSIKSVIAFMPPAPGTTTSELIFLRKQDLTDVLSKPLRTTLPLKTPPLPTDSDPTEAATIDQLTLPNIFNYSLQALQTGGAAFVLDPLT